MLTWFKNNFFPDATDSMEKGKPDGGEEPEPAKGSSSKKRARSKLDEVNQIPVYKMFGFATPLDSLLLCLGVCSAIGCGTAVPVMTIRFGGILQRFIDHEL